MRIGTIEAERGEKTFGFLRSVETRGRFAVNVPLHIVKGVSDGPVLLVQAGVSGLEIEPAMILPKIIEKLDTAEVSGTLLLVPLLNTSGFEFEQVEAIWDNKDLNTLGRGKADGTVSEQLIHTYYQEVVSQADAVLDIRTGARWGYFGYVGVYETGAEDKSRQLAMSLGLPQVLVGQPEDQSMAIEAAREGKTVVSVWIGGGPGLRDHRGTVMRRTRSIVLNAMKYLGMLAGELEPENDRVSVIQAHTFLKQPSERGFTFINKDKRGTYVRAGEQIGCIRHPFNGEVLEEINVPRSGIMLHAGAAWPVLPEGATLAILGDLIKEVAIRHRPVSVQDNDG